MTVPAPSPEPGPNPPKAPEGDPMPNREPWSDPGPPVKKVNVPPDLPSGPGIIVPPPEHPQIS